MSQKIEVGQEYYGLLYRYEVFRCKVESKEPKMSKVYNISSGEMTGQMTSDFLFKTKQEAIDFLRKEIDTLQSEDDGTL